MSLVNGKGEVLIPPAPKSVDRSFVLKLKFKKHIRKMPNMVEIGLKAWGVSAQFYRNITATTQR